jgi:hypothetical protein
MPEEIYFADPAKRVTDIARNCIRESAKQKHQRFHRIFANRKHRICQDLHYTNRCYPDRTDDQVVRNSPKLPPPNDLGILGRDFARGKKLTQHSWNPPHRHRGDLLQVELDDGGAGATMMRFRLMILRAVGRGLEVVEYRLAQRARPDAVDDAHLFAVGQVRLI